MKQRSSTLEQTARLAVNFPGCPVNELTEEQWHRLHESLVHQLAGDEGFRTDVAADIADTFSLEDYEGWFQRGRI